MLSRYDVSVDQEILEQVDSLRYTWSKMVAKALKVHVQLLEMQPQFQEELIKNMEKFKQDKIDYCSEYQTAGPMQTGLSPREASDRLILFQVSGVKLPPGGVRCFAESVRRHVEEAPNLPKRRRTLRSSYH